MTRTVITTGNAASPSAPLSQGIRKGTIPAGLRATPFAPNTGEIIGTTVAEQATQVPSNVTAALEAAGADRRTS